MDQLFNTSLGRDAAPALHRAFEPAAKIIRLLSMHADYVASNNSAIKL